MPIYAYGIKRNPLYWQGNKIGTAYRYGTKVYQSRIPEWSQAAINNMSLARNYAAVTAIPMSNVVLVAGGISQEGGWIVPPYSPFANVDIYNEAGVRTSGTNLYYAVFAFSGTYIGNNAIFVGGYRETARSTKVCMYNAAGTRTMLSNLNNYMVHNKSVTVGNYAMFSVGTQAPIYGGASSTSDVVACYDANGTLTSSTYTAQSAFFEAAVPCGSYAMIGYGRSGSYGQTHYRQISIFDSAKVRVASTWGTALSSSLLEQGVTGAKCGDGVLFAVNAKAQHVTTSGVVSTATAFSSDRVDMAAGTLSGRSVFAGGRYNYDIYNTVEVYDSSKVKTTSPFSLPETRVTANFATLNDTLYMFGNLITKHPTYGYDLSYKYIDATAHTISYK